MSTTTLTAPDTASTPEQRPKRRAAPGARRDAAKRRINAGATVASLKALAELEGVPYSSARDAAKAGAFPVAKIGNCNYVKPPEFRRWLNNKFTTAR